MQEVDIEMYIEHLKKILNNIDISFRDLLEMNIPSWVVGLFGTNASEIDVRLQKSLIGNQSYQTAQD